VSAIPITEKLLLNAGGWQAMKPARELLKSGRVSEPKYEPPLLSGYVREGAKNYRSGLRIKSALDVENLRETERGQSVTVREIDGKRVKDRANRGVPRHAGGRHQVSVDTGRWMIGALKILPRL
jgi:hypothetical protein